MKVKPVSALRSKRGLHHGNGAEPQVVGLTPQTPQTTDIPKSDNMTTFIMRQPKSVQPQKTKRSPRLKLAASGAFVDQLAGGIQDADVMLPITKIEAEGEPADDSRRGGGNDGGSSFSFHRQSISPDASLRRMSAFSSILVRLQIIN